MKNKASVSIFLAMIMIPVISIFLVLSEGVRAVSLKKLSKNTINSAGHYLNSMYQNMLFDEYHIMAIDVSKGREYGNVEMLENDVKKFLESFSNPDEDGDSFFRLRVSDAELQNIGKITDGNGKPFIKLAVISEKDNIYKNAIEGSKEYIDEFKKSDKESKKQNFDKDIENAKKTLIKEKEKGKKGAFKEEKEIKKRENEGRVYEKGKKYCKSKSFESESGGYKSGFKEIGNRIYKSTKTYERSIKKKSQSETKRINEQLSADERCVVSKNQSGVGNLTGIEKSNGGESFNGVENPLDTINSYKDEKNLSFWTGNDKKISGQKLLTKIPVSKRRLGRKGANVSISAVDRAIYMHYLHKNMGNFIKPKEHNGLKYGVEYVIAGKDSDEKNLKSVIRKIMAIREVNNAITINKSPTLNASAGALATAIGGISLNPAVIESIKAGIIASWAYVESVLDVRTLLNGGKVSFIKSDIDFTSNLYTLPMYLKNSYKAKESKSGITYKAYLDGFMAMLSIKKLGLRPQDIIEDEFKRIDMCKYFNMDNLAYECDIAVNFGGKPIFLGLTDLKDKDTRYGYVEKKHVSFIGE